MSLLVTFLIFEIPRFFSNIKKFMLFKKLVVDNERVVQTSDMKVFSQEGNVTAN